MLNVMEKVSGIQICSANFSEDGITAAEVLLYKSLNECDQVSSRRREGTNDMPTFVANDFNKLPLVKFDYIDVC